MALLLIRQDGKTPQWMDAFSSYNDTIPVYDFQKPHPKDQITMAVVWKQPKGLFGAYQNLKCIASMGAGVDFIFDDPSFNKSYLMTRVVDPLLVSDMEEFVMAHVYAHMKGLYSYHNQQRNVLWKQQPYLRKSDITIGVLGLGVLGTATAEALHLQGFNVVGWSTTKKNIAGVKSYTTPELDHFLSVSNILVCLLPLTPDTENILNKGLFRKLPKDAYLIHVARGPHLVGEDLISYLDNGHLSGAAIDVFPIEPLPQNHVFWKHPKVHITPHCASISNPASVVPQILDNYDRLHKNQPLLNQVDTLKGY